MAYITINTREEFRIAKRHVKKLVEDALKAAEKSGKRLARGFYGSPKASDNRVCLVGAIGILSKYKKEYYPEHVGSLIRNRDSQYIREPELRVLDEAFEGRCERLYKSQFLAGRSSKQVRWTYKYYRWLYKLARDLGETVGPARLGSVSPSPRRNL